MCWGFSSNSFPASTELGFALYPLNIVYYIDWFFKIYSCKSHLFIVCNPFHTLMNLICWCSAKDFCVYTHGNYHSIVLFIYFSSDTFIISIEKEFLYFLSLNRVNVIFSFKCLIEFMSRIIWGLAFLCGKSLIYQFNSLLDIYLFS